MSAEATLNKLVEREIHEARAYYASEDYQLWLAQENNREIHRQKQEDRALDSAEGSNEAYSIAAHETLS